MSGRSPRTPLENTYALFAKYGWLLPSGLGLFDGILINGAQNPRELIHMNADHILVDLYQWNIRKSDRLRCAGNQRLTRVG